MRLSTFISQNKESILAKWEDFARTIEPPALTMNAEDLRDHASYILDIIVADLETPQTPDQQSEKSMGRGPKNRNETYAEIHASARLESGYTITQLVSEYRALRASVLKLWANDAKGGPLTDPDDVMRFNEAIDQALAESVSRFADITVEHAETERLRLDAVLQAAPVGITLADEHGKLILANAENRRIWGDYPEAETVGDYRHWKGWWADGFEKHGQPLQPHEWAHVRALAGEEAPRDIIEIEPFGPPGVRRTILLHGTPVRDATKKVIGSVVAQMDITELVKAEVALRESEAKFRTITNAMPQMVWSALPNGFHDYFNQQWYDFTGTAEGSTVANEWIGLVHPEDQSRSLESWQQCLRTGDAYEIQYRLRHHSGEYRWSLGRALPIRDESGTILRWMGTCTDIHDQKIAEEKLRDADIRKDEFLAMLAHELRNPLAPISSAAGILRFPKVDESLIKQTSEIISRQVKHMTSLVDDLLDVSRVTRGLIELEKTPLDIRRIATDAVEQVNPLIHARRHHLMLHLPPESAIVVGDHKRLVQVLANLLTNAAKYTHEGGNILLKMEVESGQIVVCIEDDGIGMASELVERVFDLFAQAERTSDRTSGGLGLGLALVKSLVELHGGKVTCASKGRGLGSQFTVRLPRLLEIDQRIDRRRNSRDDIQASKTLKILVVDDNIDAAKMLSVFLEVSGHEVLVEHQSGRALERARIEKPDVCLLDIGLPEMDGNELARHLRAQPETTKAVLVAVTGYGQEHDKQKAFASGFDHHMVKPVDMTRLSAVLATVGDA
jgi:PAS domain S-box-containing protein